MTGVGNQMTKVERKIHVKVSNVFRRSKMCDESQSRPINDNFLYNSLKGHTKLLLQSYNLQFKVIKKYINIKILLH